MLPNKKALFAKNDNQLFLIKLFCFSSVSYQKAMKIPKIGIDRHKRYSNNTLHQKKMEKYMKEKTKLIRISEVIERTGFCRAWIYRLIKNNSFPSPVKTGERSIAFIESEVDAWIDEKIFYSRNQAA